MDDESSEVPAFGRRTLLGATAALAFFAAAGVDVATAQKALATTANVQAFYAQSQWRSRFGVTDSAHPTVHRGLDLAASGRQSIPILRTGVIASIGTSSIYGNYFFVKVTSADHDFYAHQYAISTSVGSGVSQGDYVSQAATYGDVTGSGWTGPHLHLGNFANSGGSLARFPGRFLCVDHAAVAAGM